MSEEEEVVDVEIDDDVGYADGDVYVETSSEGWCERLGQSWIGLCIGALLMFGSVVVLFWNEGRNVRRIRDLNEGEGSLVPLININTIEPELDGSLVYLVGNTSIGGSLADPDFGVSVSAIRLRRLVETYQWRETSERRTRETFGGKRVTETTYRYRRVWSDRLIESSRFRRPGNRRNPVRKLFESTLVAASPVTVGAFTLSDELVAGMTWWTPFSGLNASAVNVPESNTVVDVSTSNATTNIDFSVMGNMVYFGMDQNDPQIGDTRVTFDFVPTDVVSILAQQNNISLVAFETRRGGEILLLQRGEVTSDELLDDARGGNTILTWVLRVVGFAMSLFGFVMCFQPCITFADFIPFVGDLLEAGVFCIGVVVAIVMSSLTIGFAWLFYRPVVTAALFGGAAIVGIGVWYVARLRKQKKEEEGFDDLKLEGEQVETNYHVGNEQAGEQDVPVKPFAQALG